MVMYFNYINFIVVILYSDILLDFKYFNYKIINVQSKIYNIAK